MAVALAQQAGATDAVGSTTTLDVVATTTAGNLLVLEVSWNAGDSTTITVADTGGGNTWLKASKGDKSGSVATRTEIWYVINAAAITKVTITQSAASVKSATLLEFSGFGVGALSAGDTNIVGGTATPALTNTVSPLAGDLVVASMNVANTAAITVATTGSWVAATQQGTISGNRMAAAYKLSATTSESESWTITSNNWGATIAAFTPAGGIRVPILPPQLRHVSRFTHVPWVVHPLAQPDVPSAGGGAAALAGQIDGLSALTAGLTTSIQLGGTIPGQSNLPTATLTTLIKMSGQIDGVSNLPGAALTALIRFAGQIDALSSTSATLTTTIKLAGQTDGVSGLTAVLTTSIRLTSQTDGVSGLTGTLTSIGAALQGAIAAVSAVQGGLTTNIRLVGSISSVASLVADLTGGAATIRVEVIPPDEGGLAPRRYTETPYDDWTLAMDDEAVLLLLL